MKNIKTTLSLITFFSLMSLSAFAEDISPIDILSKVPKSNSQSFTGIKTQRVVRQNLKLEASANIQYADSKNFNVTINKPGGISGIKFATNLGRSTIYFPYEKLSFTDALASSGDMITETIMGKISTDLSLLQKNYNVSMKQDDQIALNPTYVIDIRPKHIRPKPEIGGKDYWSTPGRTFWISKSNYQVLREDRYWSDNTDPFFSSQYTKYDPVAYASMPNVRLKLPYNVKKVPLAVKSPDSETYMESFKTTDEAEKKLKEKVPAPKYVPPGFKLREVQALNFYDTKIIIQKYDDGLNSMYLTYRTKPNFFLTLLAGKFSLDLLHKMSDLSYHAPYNYMTRETTNNLIISFGDLYPDDLQKVNNSVAVK